MKEFKLIAEVGVNHLGSIDLAKKILDAGLEAGVKHFKFQIYNVDEFGVDKSWAWYDYMDHCAFSKEQHAELKEHCEKAGAIWFASVFGPWSFQVSKDLDMPIYKLASRSVYGENGIISELAHQIYSLGKPVISSLGYKKELWPIPLWNNNENLYCVSKYPTTRDDITWPDFNQIIEHVIEDEEGEEHKIIDPVDFKEKTVIGKKRTYRAISGFSDHSIGTELAKEAIDLGATIIEKHFTIDKTLYGPDQRGSSLPAEMKEILDYGNQHINSSV